ncbi:MAG: PLD nuclease N-terminal domain-containing protein [Coriobacteriia bacterium]|nr:PLD nuclease N-terminal domain-containing protein [Actinomycetota bacterium]MDZ4166283.1 PLD nuclease N-terminal domain-containing protein [Coriobacteriia bacterium]
MNGFDELSSIPGWLQAVLAVYIVVQLGVEIYVLVRLFRTPDERLVFGKKWPWVIIILFVNLIGAIVFLAVGRTAAPADDPLAGSGALDGGPETADRAARAADVLYGTRDGESS